MWGQRTEGFARVLELDPELADGLAGADFEEARAALRAPLVSIPAGQFNLATVRRRAVAGCLIIDGLACREIKLRECHAVELLGPGDVIQPPSGEAPALPLGGPTITAISELLVAELDEEFGRCAGRWPGLLTGLLDRLARQHQRLVEQELIVHVRRADERLLLMLWLLANRWGRVTPQGIHLRLCLTHELLGHLIAAQRPTVSLSLAGLEESELVSRLADGTWMLSPRAEETVMRIAHTTSGPVLGHTLRLRQRAMELQNDASALRASARLAAGQAGSRRQPRAAQ